MIEELRRLDTDSITDIMRRGKAPPSRAPKPEHPSYYGYPAIKRPEWRSEIPVYFFAGGLAAGSYLVATLADLFGTEEDRVVARIGRYLALVTTLLCPLLLIADLGRPERFTHMMRILKTRSPMSMGSWGLMGFGLFVGLGALRQAVEDGLIGARTVMARLLAWVPFRASGILGSLFAFFISGYTGVLLTFTNVPLWASNRLLQAPLFITSALSSGVSAISLILTARGGAPKATRAWLDRTGNAAALGELAMTVGSMGTLRSQAWPLLTVRFGLPYWLGTVGMGANGPLRPTKGQQRFR
ncbi:MAG TPA: NrfD/PsrC family molybdoenzyme membrane anchor subunit [Chloroflexota bacterium]|nr:NrfD/PsrC family molybdoenzyme membrane anchor subunit [Chloroflexota bacterium]